MLLHYFFSNPIVNISLYWNVFDSNFLLLLFWLVFHIQHHLYCLCPSTTSPFPFNIPSIFPMSLYVCNHILLTSCSPPTVTIYFLIIRSSMYNTVPLAQPCRLCLDQLIHGQLFSPTPYHHHHPFRPAGETPHSLTSHGAVAPPIATKQTTLRYSPM